MLPAVIGAAGGALGDPPLRPGRRLPKPFNGSARPLAPGCCPIWGLNSRAEAELGHIDVVQEMIRFLRNSPKGISPMRGRLREEAA